VFHKKIILLVVFLLAWGIRV